MRFSHQVASWALLLGPLGCQSPEHEVLSSAAIDAAGGAASRPAGAGGTATGIDAGQSGGNCPNGQCLPPPPKPPCRSDLQCPPKQICATGKCEPCPDPPQTECACDFGWMSIPLERNGCRGCGCKPPLGCTKNSDCTHGRICYPGAACDPGCMATTPADQLVSCCWGNLCAAPGCPDTSRLLDCLIVGCPFGSFCTSTCGVPKCDCDPNTGQWRCDPSCPIGTSTCGPPLF